MSRHDVLDLGDEVAHRPAGNLEVQQADNAYALIAMLRDRREELHLSQAEVARRMGRHQSVVSTIERLGADPRWSSLRRYASALGVLIDYGVTSLEDAEMARAAVSGARPDAHGVDVMRAAASILASR